MKVLLSAYACEPNKGSEPGVGWNWAIELSRLKHKVWVITRSNNRSEIETEFSRNPKPANLHFIYYDLPNWARFWKKGGRGIHLYYLLWQLGAYCYAKRKHREILFDLVHHVTFVSMRQPSFMGNLGIPFIFGPVAGGEHAPWPLRLSYNFKGFILDAVRDLANFFVKFDPLMHCTFAQATKIYVTSEDTLGYIPSVYRHKTLVQLAIGLDEVKLTLNSHNNIGLKHTKKHLRILYVGHFIYWKGMHIGLRAFAKLVRSGIDARLTMIGKGPDEQQLRKFSKTLKVSNRIDWVSWISQDKLSAFYDQHDVLLFPSLHDSGGMVILEALAHGLPVVCLDLGGPGQIVDSSCGIVIHTKKSSIIEVSSNMYRSLKILSLNPYFLNILRQGATKKANIFNWSSIVRRLYRDRNSDS